LSSSESTGHFRRTPSEARPESGIASDASAVADAIRSHDRFLVTTHENPDGDALGSLLAAKLGLEQLGKDVVMYLAGEAPLPREYSWMPFGNLRRTVPDDAADRLLLALDCANESRLGPDPEVLASAPLVVNVDHHHDNSRFGGVNLVVADASSTGEIVRDLFAALELELTPEIAEALYIALVTDTGRFQYANTTPKALRLAAELVEAGADVHKVFQGVYESVQFAKLKLLARALERAQIYEGGRLVISYLLRGDFAEVGAAEPYSEGIIDYLRAVEGADMAALIREPPRGDAPARRISLRASTDELDVSEIARRSGEGGGHRQAAGFTSDDSIEEITEFIRREFVATTNGS
jgi:bifunctional oligoribonuclease and PAP phosphatase NrnA